jgi:hypothetical protein
MNSKIIQAFSFVYLVLGITGCLPASMNKSSIDGKFSAFDAGMRELLQGSKESEALGIYKGSQKQSFEYAKQICSHFEAGNSDLNFSDYEYGRVKSATLSEAEIQYFSALEATSIFFVCPEQRENSPYK